MPNRQIPPGTEQAWEKLRSDVAVHAANQEQHGAHVEIERRVSKLEARLQVIAERMVSKREALAASYGVMAEALDKLVTRSEFDVVKTLTYLIAGGVVISALVIVIKHMFLQ